MSFLFELTKSPFRTRAWLALGLSISLGGCIAIANGGKKEEDVGGGAEGDGDGDTGPTDVDVETRERCRDATAAAKAFLESQCASCHTPGASDTGGFTTVLSVNKMIDDGLIVPANPDSSALYAVLKGKTMPPASVENRPTAQNAADVHDWIACGAPAQARAADAPAFIDIDERLGTMLKDLRTFDPPDRKDVRYLDLYELSNAGFSEAELDVYRQALSFVMNSLSHGQDVVPPQRVDDRGLLFRIELNDYGWTPETWGIIANEYPYAVQYNNNSELFPYDEVSNEQIRKETAEPIAYVQADWFVSNAARPPLYNELLDLPGTLNGLAAQLGVTMQANIANGEALRAGFRQASSTQYDRVVERHEQPGSGGALWISYDFNSGVGNSDVFAHPLDFVPAGTQAMFTLENGLSGYMVFDADGQAIDKAPTDIIQDPHARDGAAETGIGCLSCHAKGPIAHEDELRDGIGSTLLSIEDREKALALYASKEELAAAFKEDIDRYTAARKLSLSPVIKDETIHEIDDRHLDVLTLSEVAGVLGVPEQDLDRALNAPAQLPASVRTLSKDGAYVRRDALEADFEALVKGLNLGQPYSRDDLLGGGGGDDDEEPVDDGSSDEEPTDEEPTDDDTTTDDPPADDTTDDPPADETDGGTAEDPDYPYYP